MGEHTQGGPAPDTGDPNMDALLVLAEERGWNVVYIDTEEICVAFGRANIIMRRGLDDVLEVAVETRFSKGKKEGLRQPNELRKVLGDWLGATSVLIAGGEAHA
jgi:hypothetical protein